jgi:hypothetical protein
MLRFGKASRSCQDEAGRTICLVLCFRIDFPDAVSLDVRARDARKRRARSAVQEMVWREDVADLIAQYEHPEALLRSALGHLI